MMKDKGRVTNLGLHLTFLVKEAKVLCVSPHEGYLKRRLFVPLKPKSHVSPDLHHYPSRSFQRDWAGGRKRGRTGGRREEFFTSPRMRERIRPRSEDSRGLPCTCLITSPTLTVPSLWGMNQHQPSDLAKYAAGGVVSCSGRRLIMRRLIMQREGVFYFALPGMRLCVRLKPYSRMGFGGLLIGADIFIFKYADDTAEECEDEAESITCQPTRM
jgi:hypothetical protein